VQQIFRRPLGGGTLRQITRGSAPAFSMSLSPDSRFTGLHTVATGLRRAFVASSEGGDRPVQVTRGVCPDERNPVGSPDVSRLAWQRLESGRARWRRASSKCGAVRRCAAARLGRRQTNGRGVSARPRPARRRRRKAARPQIRPATRCGSRPEQQWSDRPREARRCCLCNSPRPRRRSTHRH